MPVFRDGYEICVPTSTAVTGAGSSATINTKGSVTFTSCATLELRGVFSSTYDNYFVMFRMTTTQDDAAPVLRFLVGTTEASGTNYTWQLLRANTTTITGSRQGSEPDSRFIECDNTFNNGAVLSLYGPNLSQPTAWRSITAGADGGGEISDYAGTHSLSTSYDGLKISVGVGSMTGLVCVYGAVQ